MKRQLFYTVLFFTAILTGCSGDDNNGSVNSNDRIIGTWESWKEVTDDGETYSLNEYDCPQYVEVYNSDGKGSEKQYYHIDNGCEQLYSTSNTWSNQGGDNYKISNGSISATHHYTFIDDNTYYQRDEENASNIYFKRKVN